MTNNEMTVFKKRIVDTAKAMLTKEYGYTRSEADAMIIKSCLEEAIERKPLLFVHVTPEQVLDIVFD